MLINPKVVSLTQKECNTVCGPNAQRLHLKICTVGTVRHPSRSTSLMAETPSAFHWPLYPAAHPQTQTWLQSNHCIDLFHNHIAICSYELYTALNLQYKYVCIYVLID